MTARAAGRPRTHCAVEFQALPSRIGQVRRIITAQLRYWRLEALIDAAALGVTELLTNVVRHTGSDKHCTVEVVFRKDHLTVSVRDHDPRLPRVRTAEPSATTGRGLALIAAVSASWGMQAQHDGSGKVVWFTLPVTLGAPPQRAAAVSPKPEDSALPALAATAGAGSVMSGGNGSGPDAGTRAPGVHGGPAGPAAPPQP